MSDKTTPPDAGKWLAEYYERERGPLPDAYVWSETSNMPENLSTLAVAREVGVILRSLYIAIGAATMLDDGDLKAELIPIVQRYRERTREELGGEPFP